jgi:hypothetical protein
MPDLPWTARAEMEPGNGYLVMASHLPLQRITATVRFFRAVSAVRKQLATAEGLIGYTLRAKPSTGRIPVQCVLSERPPVASAQLERLARPSGLVARLQDREQGDGRDRAGEGHLAQPPGQHRLQVLHPPFRAPAPLAVRDTLAITRRNLRRLGRAPNLLLLSLATGVLFVLLFRYVSGGAIGTPGISHVD